MQRFVGALGRGARVTIRGNAAQANACLASLAPFHRPPLAHHKQLVIRPYRGQWRLAGTPKQPTVDGDLDRIVEGVAQAIGLVRLRGTLLRKSRQGLWLPECDPASDIVRLLVDHGWAVHVNAAYAKDDGSRFYLPRSRFELGALTPTFVPEPPRAQAKAHVFESTLSQDTAYSKLGFRPAEPLRCWRWIAPTLPKNAPTPPVQIWRRLTTYRPRRILRHFAFNGKLLPVVMQGVPATLRRKIGRVIKLTSHDDGPQDGVVGLDYNGGTLRVVAGFLEGDFYARDVSQIDLSLPMLDGFVTDFARTSEDVIPFMGSAAILRGVVFLFLGPKSRGKSHLADAIARRPDGQAISDDYVFVSSAGKLLALDRGTRFRGELPPHERGIQLTRPNGTSIWYRPTGQTKHVAHSRLVVVSPRFAESSQTQLTPFEDEDILDIWRSSSVGPQETPPKALLCDQGFGLVFSDADEAVSQLIQQSS